MTRINLVPVEDLADQHLFAEWREIKMVPASLRRSLKTRSIKDILAGVPKRYTLNKGHVTFFFDKMQFLTDRYELLTDELLNRGYNGNFDSTFDKFTSGLPDEFCQVMWAPDAQEVSINVERILLRIEEKVKPWYRYRGEIKDLEFFKNKYKL